MQKFQSSDQHNPKPFLLFCQTIASIHHPTLPVAFNRHAFALAACEKSLVSSSLPPHLQFTVCKLLDGKRVQSIIHRQIPTLSSGFMTKVNLSMHGCFIFSRYFTGSLLYEWNSYGVWRADMLPNLANDRLCLRYKDVLAFHCRQNMSS